MTSSRPVAVAVAVVPIDTAAAVADAHVRLLSLLPISPVTVCINWPIYNINHRICTQTWTTTHVIITTYKVLRELGNLILCMCIVLSSSW